jgi:hypothetical protein
VADKLSWYRQLDFLSLIREFSGGKLKQKGFFHPPPPPPSAEQFHIETDFSKGINSVESMPEEVFRKLMDTGSLFLGIDSSPFRHGIESSHKTIPPVIYLKRERVHVKDEKSIQFLHLKF